MRGAPGSRVRGAKLLKAMIAVHTGRTGKRRRRVHRRERRRPRCAAGEAEGEGEEPMRRAGSDKSACEAPYIWGSQP
jgi:hypothetical protein